jgi:ribokinase
MDNVRILVVGSIVLDRVLRVAEFPRPGESVRGEVVGVFPGGKGANQAVCAARLGASTSFCAAIGPDPDGTEMIMKLRSEQIDCSMVHSIERAATGTAGITLNDLGQNTIVVALGANMMFEPEQALKAAHQQLHHVLLLQGEIPLEASRAAAEASQGLVIFNPAPAIAPPLSMYPLIDVLTPNESEAEYLVGYPIHDEKTAEKAATELIVRGCKSVVITLGAKGAYFRAADDEGLIKAPTVSAVDTVGAGDCFNGALAFALAHKLDLRRATRFAVQCASYSVQHVGAQTGMPYFDELDSDIRALISS